MFLEAHAVCPAPPERAAPRRLDELCDHSPLRPRHVLRPTLCGKIATAAWGDAEVSGHGAAGATVP